MTPKILLIIQAISAILLVVVILLQQKGSGLGAAFGGSSNIFSTRRGIDKTLFRATIVIAVIFFGVAVASLMV
ncbi:MAG: preprotein translocase subunit SecG [Candidatus Magasanikbacteria bacterium]|nr:preprotein translocase subunit SecG [Candidatus Magasanikbacteria bacterium]